MGGGHKNTGLNAPPMLTRHQVFPPSRPLSARIVAGQYLRQSSDASIGDTWAAAADNLGTYSNRLPIDPLRSARGQTSTHHHPSSAKRRPNSARAALGGASTGRVKGGLDFNFARTPSVAAAVVRGAEVPTLPLASPVSGGRVRGERYAHFYTVGSIPVNSRKSIGALGGADADGGNFTFKSRGGQSPLRRPRPNSIVNKSDTQVLELPIYISKNRAAEWTSDSILHPLLLSQRSKGWAATPCTAPRGASTLTAAGRATVGI